MSNTNKQVELELGEPSQLSMDEFCRKLIGQMFEYDNAITKIELELDTKEPDTDPPKIVLEIALVSINGTPTGAGRDDA